MQFFLNTVQKIGNFSKKTVIKQTFWLVNEQRSSQVANQIFCFQIKRTPWMAQFFLDCVIIKITWGLAHAKNWEESSESVKFKTFFMQIFSCILLIGNHAVFLVQFGINLHLWVFQKAKLHSPKQLVQFQLFEKLTRANHEFQIVLETVWLPIQIAQDNLLVVYLQYISTFDCFYYEDSTATNHKLHRLVDSPYAVHLWLSLRCLS